MQDPPRIIFHNPRKYIRKRLQARTQTGSWWCMDITPVLSIAIQESPGHLDERGLDSSAVFQNFYVITYSTLSCKTQLRSADTALRTASRARQCWQKIAADLSACAAAWGPMGLMTTFKLLALAPPPQHRVESSRGAAVGFKFGGSTHTAALKSAYKGADYCTTIENDGVALQYHHAAASVNWL
jgi:hypothetical protein